MKRSSSIYSSHCKTKKGSPDSESLPLVFCAVIALLEKPTGSNFNEFNIIHTIFTEESVMSTFRTLTLGRWILQLFRQASALPLFHSILPGQAGVLYLVKRWEQGGIILTPFWQLAILSQTLKQHQKNQFPAARSLSEGSGKHTVYARRGRFKGWMYGVILI